MWNCRDELGHGVRYQDPEKQVAGDRPEPHCSVLMLSTEGWCWDSNRHKGEKKKQALR